MQYCRTFSPCSTWQGPGSTHSCSWGWPAFNKKKTNGTTGPICTPQPPLYSQAWKQSGVSSSIRGYDSQDHDLLCSDAAIDIFYWLCKVFVNLLIDKFNMLCQYFLIRENFHVYKIHLHLGIISLRFFSLFDVKTTVGRCLRVLTNDSTPNQCLQRFWLCCGSHFADLPSFS